MDTSDSPLADLRVLDLSRVMAGPYSGRLLRDLGADVVKLEPPEGDLTRMWGEEIGGLSGYYTQQNAGKRNICVDLKTPEGSALARRLASRADVVIENFRPGVMARLGLGYEAIAEDNPRLVMVSITGFGQDGPESQRQAYAPIIHAEAGYIARHAEMDGNPPSDPIFSLGDSYSALHATVALLSALHMRERTGRGQHIDLAMLRAMVATDDYSHEILDGALPLDRLGGYVFEAPGGPILIAGQWKVLWYQARTVWGLEADPGASFEEKLANREQEFRRFVREHESRESLARDLARADLAWGEVREMRDVFDSPTLREGSFAEVSNRAGGSRRVVQAPYRFSGAASGIRGPAPHRGEHNREVLADWLESDASEISSLEERGVLLRNVPEGTTA